MTSEKLLSRLEFVKQTGDQKWIARCPAHDDKSPSLSVAETGDGRVLVNCHAGCGALDVLSSVGLEFTDLFPDRLENHHSIFGRKRRDKSVDEITLMICESDRKEGKKLSRDDKQAELQAFLRMKRDSN